MLCFIFFALLQIIQFTPYFSSFIEEKYWYILCNKFKLECEQSEKKTDNIKVRTIYTVKMTKILVIDEFGFSKDKFPSFFGDKNINVLSIGETDNNTEFFDKEVPDIIILFTGKVNARNLSLLKKIRNRNDLYYPIVIFISGEMSSLDLKRVMSSDIDDVLFHPVEEAVLLKSIKSQIKKRENLLKYLSKTKPTKADKSKSDENIHPITSDYIFLDDKHHPGFYSLNSIIYIQSLGDYTKLCVEGKRKIVLHKTLSFWESYLPSSTFLRIHRQTIINLKYVESVERSGAYNYKIKLRNIKGEFTISQRYTKKIKSRLGVG